jgi:hypothetical protein
MELPLALVATFIVRRVMPRESMFMQAVLAMALAMAMCCLWAIVSQ